MTSTPPSHSLPLSRLLNHGADALAAVLSGRSLSDALADVPVAARPGTQALSFHAMRWLAGAQAARRALAPRRPPPAAESLLLLALALLWPRAAQPYPAHTLVSQAVTCARQRVPASAGFINAVLRRFLDRASDLATALEAQDPEVRWQHPRWWIDRLRIDWPEHWQALLLADQMHPPMTLRVNARRSSGAAYLTRLQASGIEARLLGDAETSQMLELVRPMAVQALPGFAEGEVSVQDAHAQQAAPLLLGVGADTLRPGARVLDACAAPGGKTAHLLELADVEVLALDVDEARLSKVQETLTRLGLQAQARVADARKPADWWDGRPFDAILLDAPCSASGIVRRHPDVRWLRRDSDIDALARTQAELLDALWPLLAPGGRLVYATCSVFRAEGSQQVEAFLQRQARATHLAEPGHLLGLTDNAPSGASPSSLGGDGFYYARLNLPR